MAGEGVKSKFTDPKSEHENFTTKEKQDRQEKCVCVCLGVYIYIYIIIYILYNYCFSQQNRIKGSKKDTRVLRILLQSASQWGKT